MPRIGARRLGCLGLAMAFPASASAAISAFFRPANITPAAVADDPVLEVMQSWDIVVNCDGDWSSAGVEAKLPTGFTFYNHTLGGNTRPNPGIVALFPAVAFDTYVTAPSDNGSSGAPAILGPFPEAPGPGDFGGTTGRFSVSWGNLVFDPPGTYEIARLTFRRGLVPALNPLNQVSQVNPASTATLGPLTPPQIRDSHWVPDADGAWHVPGNWSSGVPGATPSPNAYDHAYIDVGGATVRTVTHSQGTHTVTTLLSQEHLEISGGLLSVNVYARLGNGLNMTGGTFAGSDVLRVNGELSLSGPGSINLIQGTLINDYSGPSPLPSVRDYIVSGYNNGSWDGTGVYSSTAAGNSALAIGYAEASALLADFPATYMGESIDDSTLLVRLVRSGDANLDGRVNLDDFNRLAAKFGSTDALWDDGDFNYDGNVNLSDFNLLAANFGISAAGSSVTPGEWAQLGSTIPEPAGVAGTWVCALVLLRRRHG